MNITDIKNAYSDAGQQAVNMAAQIGNTAQHVTGNVKDKAQETLSATQKKFNERMAMLCDLCAIDYSNNSNSVSQNSASQNSL